MMSLHELLEAIAHIRPVALAIRVERKAAGHDRAALEHQATREWLDEPKRRQTDAARRDERLKRLAPDVVGTLRLIDAMNAERSRYSVESYISTRRLNPRAARLPEWPAGSREAQMGEELRAADPVARQNYERAQRERARDDQHADLLNELMVSNLRTELRDESRDEIAARLAALDGSERSAATLREIHRELRSPRHTEEDRVRLRGAVDAATQRIFAALPEVYRKAGEVFAELDVLDPLVRHNWAALESGNDQAVQNWETSHFVIVEDGKAVSLAVRPNERLTDEARQRLTAFRDAEAATDRAATHTAIRDTLHAAALRAADAATQGLSASSGMSPAEASKFISEHGGEAYLARLRGDREAAALARRTMRPTAGATPPPAPPAPPPAETPPAE